VILREVGSILCSKFGGSYQILLQRFHYQNGGQGTCLDLVRLITNSFPSFRDEILIDGRKVYFWKRAQILVAETWAAFHPEDNRPHPIIPRGVSELTMFADYRVPQILQLLGVLTYPQCLMEALRARNSIDSGSAEEISIRSASILAVEEIRREIGKLKDCEEDNQGAILEDIEVNSVIIDFWLWDMAKRIESGESVEDPALKADPLPAHRARSIWY